MSPINVGVSEYPGRTHGKMQVMTKVQAGLNLRAAIFELERDYGEIATVNEADRSRPDQLFMRAEFLAGRGALAAYCTSAPPPGQYTSTHDPVNHGDGADLGGPGGAVLSVRAHNLLDGNHPDGVLGRKYGLYNTGAAFYIPEWWHFNIYPARAAKLATLRDSLPVSSGDSSSSNKESKPLMKIIHAKAGHTLVGETGTRPFDPLTVSGQVVLGSQQIPLIERVLNAPDKDTLEHATEFNNQEVAIIDAVIADLNKDSEARIADAAAKATTKSILAELKKQGVIK